jgi:hypothetical protein
MRAAAFEALCTLLQRAEDVYILGNNLLIVGGEPVQSHPRLGFRRLVALASSVRRLYFNAFDIAVGVSVDSWLQLDGALKTRVI